MEQSPYKLIVTKSPVFRFIVMSARVDKETLTWDRWFPAHDTDRSYHSGPGRLNSLHKLFNLNVAYAMAQSVQRRATGCTGKVRFSTGSEAPPSSQSNWSRWLFLGGGGRKLSRREVDHSHPSDTEVKNSGAITSLLHTFLWHGA
jgi:hypothetical protein